MKQNPFSIRKTVFIFLVCFISGSITAQKIDLDLLDIDQLNLYKEKAVKLRNTGRTLTLSGVGVMVTGFVTGVIMLNNVEPHGPPEDPHGSLLGFAVIGLSGLVGIPCTVVGIPLWAVGGSRKSKAELTLQKFTLAPEKSMAVGLGITLKF
jgi:hypothetical protein